MAAEAGATPKSGRTWLWACGGFAATFVLGCCLLGGGAAVMRRSRPTARDLYSGAPDRAAGEDVSNALISAGIQGASVLVIPIKASAGQIAIITLDESQGYTGFGAAGADSLKTVVTNIVNADRAGNLAIEQLSIDYRDESGKSSLSFTTTMDKASAYAAGEITREEFVGNVDFNLMDTMRYYGLDQILQGTPRP